MRSLPEQVPDINVCWRWRQRNLGTKFFSWREPMSRMAPFIRRRLSLRQMGLAIRTSIVHPPTLR